MTTTGTRARRLPAGRGSGSACAAGLADEFRCRVPRRTAEIPWSAYEERAVTWSPSINLLDPDRPRRRAARPRPALLLAGPAEGRRRRRCHQRAGASADRPLLASAANVIRRSPRPPTRRRPRDDQLGHGAAEQVANVQWGVPNVVLEQDEVNTLIEGDLRLAVMRAWTRSSTTRSRRGASKRPAPTTRWSRTGRHDDAVGGRVQPGHPDPHPGGGRGDRRYGQRDQRRHGRFRVRAGRLRPRSHFQFAAGGLEGGLVGRGFRQLCVREAVRLARRGWRGSRRTSGKSNTSLIRLELHAACGVERQTAAVRIAAS